MSIIDTRRGSVKRVAAAVGEGAQLVLALHTFLAEHSRVSPPRETLGDAGRERLFLVGVRADPLRGLRSL